MRRLVGRIRPYDWGSRESIARVQGRPVPTPGPEAELWLGAHPGDPSTVDGVRLDELIADDPVGQLGAAVVARFGGRLPFLLKLIAAGQPLSLQVHPNLEQAGVGFAEEAAAGIPIDAPRRRYKDANHKPEMLVALTETEALCGFAPTGDSVALLDGLIECGAAWLGPWRDSLAVGKLETTVAELLALRGSADLPDFSELVTAYERLAEKDEKYVRAAGAFADLVRRFPVDPGVLVALLLNHVRLAPGEAIFLPAGNPHAYLNGFGVEIMAASDNVLRGGLTSKYVDEAELVRILRFEPTPAPVVRPEVIGATRRWPTPTAEFSLREWRGGPDATGEVTFPSDTPVVAVCVEGEVTVSVGADRLTLRSGESGWQGAGHAGFVVSGSGRLFLAAIGDQTRD